MDQNTKDMGVIREPIMTSKAEMQTIFITTGYGWSQSKDSVVIYVTFENANDVNDNYSFNVLQRSLELNITSLGSVNYRFKLTHLYDFIVPEKSTIKFKGDKITIKLFKLNVNKQWQDLNMKSTQNKYNELERFVKQNGAISSSIHFETPFKEEPMCPEHHH